MKYWQTKHFISLQRAWYERLADDGFEDAEEIVGDDCRLKQSAAAPYRYRGLDPVDIESKESYFLILGSHVQGSVFQSDVDRLILTMFSEGAKIARIIDALAIHGKRRCRGTVRYTIRKYEMAWGIRQYTPQQLNKKTRKSA